MKIITAQRNETAEYAASELKKYVVAMSDGKIIPQICYVDKLPEAAPADGILLGLLEELSLDTSDLQDAYIEDIIDVDVVNGAGYIAGSNMRSILMGIYKYCHSAGCRFLRPGPDGDYVPSADLLNHSFKYRKKADHPFRGECTEGAVSYEHIRDTVYWLPKIGMNMYMIEGFIPYGYMHKWYGHIGNRFLRQKGQETDVPMIQRYISMLEQDIKRAGIQLHTLGHAWMFRKLGVMDGPAHRTIVNLKEEDREYIALLNGKRDFKRGSPFFTHMCYSNPKARKLLVDTLIEYIEEHPYVDFVHAWLADSPNNQCECEECAKMEPSDHYVVLLNELDAEMTKRGMTNRIVFIMYVDTERPPVKMRLNNPDRFILLIAIGTQENYNIGEYEGEEPPYVRNQFKPQPKELRMKWYRRWKQLCNDIPSFVFEYRFYSSMYCDLGHMQLSRETYEGMRSLKNADLGGCVSDQTHRMYMPTSLPLMLMGQTQFDRELDYDRFVAEYFTDAFGEDGAACRTYLEELSDLLSPKNFRVGGTIGIEEEGLGDIDPDDRPWINNPDVAEKAAKIPGVVDAFAETINRNIAYATDNARLLSWQYLKYHAQICKLFSVMLEAGAKNNGEAMLEAYQVLEDYVMEHEMEFHNGFDSYLFTKCVRAKVGLPAAKYYDGI